MKKLFLSFKILTTTLALLFCVALYSQSIYPNGSFRVYLYGKPIHRTKAGLDSVYAVHPRPFMTASSPTTMPIAYVGEMKDGLPHGVGTYFHDRLPVYSGQWVNGEPEGYGVLIEGTPNTYMWKFRGYFKNGLPVNGLVRYSPERELLYSGDVKLSISGQELMPHGYGRFFVTPGAPHWKYLAGSYHEGQFINGAPTGYGVYNIREGTPGLLRVGLTLTGAEVKNFDNLGISANIMIWKNAVQPGEQMPAVLKKVLPDIDKAVFDSILINKGVVYYGQTYRNDPYGLGIIKYDDGLAEFGFWKNGELIPTKALLKMLLPDSTVLEPVAIETFYPTVQYTVNKKLKKYERKPIVILVNEKRKVLYYGKLVNGQPAGYGWAIDTSANGLPIAANFTGVASKDQWSSDTTFVQVTGNAPSDLGYSTTQWYDKVVRPVQSTHFNSLSNYPVAIDRNGKSLVYDKPSWGGVILFPTSAMLDPTPFAATYKKALDDDALKARQMNSVYASRPSATVSKVVIYSKNPSGSYIVTSAGNLSGLWLTSSQVQAGDAVFTGSGFDYANLHGIVPIGSPMYSGKYLVVRSHNLNNSILESTCSVCKGTGGTTSTNSIQVKDGYKTSVNYNTPGYSNGAIVYTPNYKSVGTYQSKSVCSACKGRPYNRSNKTVIEIY